MGIALFSEHKLADARPWLERAQLSEKHRQMARSYLQAIASELKAAHPTPD
jgi:hypothetical protein